MNQTDNNTQKPGNWANNANIYEVNIRQYTPEGTFNAFRKHLPRLQKMGVNILWLMPINPIGEKNRKGSLGSYYAVKDYEAVNPEYGTLDDLRALVNEAHQRGMHVLIDWVANHTAWDNAWASTHPEYYEKDEKGNFKSPFDWTDVIQLNYKNPQLRKAMIHAMKYWVVNADVDGFRCDVAGMVPVDFWEEARQQLDAVKPVFMLAEDEDNTALVQKAFDMNYAWKMLHLMNDIAAGKKQAADIWEYLDWNNKTFPADKFRMYFTTNHDENSWNGTALERLGQAFKAFTVFDYTIPGMPLTYSGQEAGNTKPLRFFDKDTIDLHQLPYENLYTKLNKLKSENKALWAGSQAASLVPLSRGVSNQVMAFYREADHQQVVVILNLSNTAQTFKIDTDAVKGSYQNFFTGENLNIETDWIFKLKAWDYVVLVKK
jgi:1,4-alpha-glucan branching enzyme